MDPLAVETILTPHRSVQIALAIIGGTALGSISGLVPGLHANNFALLLASVIPALAIDPLLGGVAMLAAGVTHTFLNAVPALAIGVPDAEMAVTALPGHRLVMAGRGQEALRLSALGSAIAVVVALPLAVPITAGMSVAYPYVIDRIEYLIAAVAIGLLAAEPTIRRRLVGAITFGLSSGLGLWTLDLDPNAPLEAGGMLAPLFAGLFGAPLLLEAMAGGGIPKQDDGAIRSTPGRVGMTAAAGALAGALVGYLPAISAAIAAVAVLVAFPGDVTDRGYVVATSGVDTANAIFALFALVAIGQPRTGIMVALDESGVPTNLPVLLSTVLVAGAIGTVLVVTVGDRYLRWVQSVSYTAISITVLAGLLVLSGLFAGLTGIVVFVLAALIGLVPVRLGAYRVHCMGVLMGPIVLG